VVVAVDEAASVGMIEGAPGAASMRTVRVEVDVRPVWLLERLKTRPYNSARLQSQ